MTALQIEAPEVSEVAANWPILRAQVIHHHKPAHDLVGACACRATICTNSLLKSKLPSG